MSFYRNFGRKEDVLKRWIKVITDTFLAESRISFKNDDNRDYFIKLFAHMKQHQAICAALYKADLIYLVKEQFDMGSYVFIITCTTIISLILLPAEYTTYSCCG